MLKVHSRPATGASMKNTGSELDEQQKAIVDYRVFEIAKSNGEQPKVVDEVEMQERVHANQGTTSNDLNR